MMKKYQNQRRRRPRTRSQVPSFIPFLIYLLELPEPDMVVVEGICDHFQGHFTKEQVKQTLISGGLDVDKAMADLKYRHGNPYSLTGRKRRQEREGQATP